VNRIHPGAPRERESGWIFAAPAAEIDRTCAAYERCDMLDRTAGRFLEKEIIKLRRGVMRRTLNIRSLYSMKRRHTSEQMRVLYRLGFNSKR